MTDWLLTAAACAALVWAGWPWARGIPGNRPDAVATAGLAYLCGTALFTLAILGAAFLGLELDRLTLGICLVTVRLAGRLVAGDRPPARPVPGSFRLAVLPLAPAGRSVRKCGIRSPRGFPTVPMHSSVRCRPRYSYLKRMSWSVPWRP